MFELYNKVEQAIEQKQKPKKIKKAKTSLLREIDKYIREADKEIKGIFENRVKRARSFTGAKISESYLELLPVYIVRLVAPAEFSK